MKLEGSFSRRTGGARVRKYLFGIRSQPDSVVSCRPVYRDVDGANFIVRARCRYQMGGRGGAEEMEKWPGGRSSGRGRRNARSSLMKNGGTLDDSNSFPCLRQPTAASQLNFNQ